LDQRVTVTLEMYEPGEPHSEFGPEWELDATGIFPQLVKDQLSLRSDTYEYFWLPFAPEVGRLPLRSMGHWPRREPRRDGPVGGLVIQPQEPDRTPAALGRGRQGPPRMRLHYVGR
jgi:hypothetical protein